MSGRREVQRKVGGSSPARSKARDRTQSTDISQQQQHPRPQDLTADDSFAEERFITSWEHHESLSHSYDEGGGPNLDESRPRSSASRPGSTASRRKRFDTTTPTLIDEDYDRGVDFEEDDLMQAAGHHGAAMIVGTGGGGDHDDVDEEMLTLTQMADHRESSTTGEPGGRTFSFSSSREEEGGTVASSSNASMRRTPGASMYKSPFYSQTAADEGMRRTPGAMSATQHRSASVATVGSVSSPTAGVPTSQAVGADIETAERGNAGSSGSQTESDQGALGFALTLSTPVAAGDGNQEALGNRRQATHRGATLEGDHRKEHPSSSRIWDSFASHSASPSPILPTRSIEQQRMDAPSRPPLAPTPAGGSRSAMTAPFSFAQWTTAARSPTTVGSTASEHQRRAVSPNILRLTEDIGNLLLDDEDDAVALEIPSVFRGEGSDTAALSGDWTGSYVFGSSTGTRNREVQVQGRGNAAIRQQSRRRVSGSSFAHSLQAQQPKPRRWDQDVFEFGQERHDRASPQPLNFGGAFAPPPHVQPGLPFMRPVASAPVDMARAGSGYVPQTSVVPPGGQSGGSSAFGSHGGMPSFSSYQSTLHSSSTSHAAPQLAFDAHPGMSEMQATAREFVPQSVPKPTQNVPLQHPRVGTPSGPEEQQRWASHHQATYTPSSEDQLTTWYSAPYNYVPPMGHQDPSHSHHSGRSTVESQVQTSQQPLVAPWQAQQPLVVVDEPRRLFSVDQATVPPAVAAPAPVRALGTREMQQGPDNQRSVTSSTRGKETKRGKRGKKKPKAESSMGKTDKTKPERPESALSQADSTDDQGASSFVPKDPLETKRAELVESPTTRVAFKEFSRNFREREKQSFQLAEEYAFVALNDESLPEAVHWRVYLELADLAKRSNRFTEARRLYQKVCQLQPCASQGWLEYSKLEEECGHMNRVANILHAGLEFCEFSENLLTRAVKHEEKIGNLKHARELLARLKHFPIDRVWKTVLEGALLEYRAGNYAMARRVLKYVMHHVPWYGPLYLEAYKLERDLSRNIDALQIVERGLQAIPRYGPLWFAAFRIFEDIDIAEKRYDLPRAMEAIAQAITSISRELVWKVHLEAAQMLERSAIDILPEGQTRNVLLISARERFAATILSCPQNLRWKVWLAAARMDLVVGNFDRSRRLFVRAHKSVPEKGRSSTLLECSRLEEFVGNASVARAVLSKARSAYGNDSKLWLESVLLEVRNQDLPRALELVSLALDLHPSTGRLWAASVQLSRFNTTDQEQHATMKRALNAVPKSGEVWCEGARIYMNPFSSTFDLIRARRLLTFATKFTPQYGDSFVELLRLEFLEQWLSPISAFIWNETKHSYPTGKSGGHDDWVTKYITDVMLAISVALDESSGRSQSEQKRQGLPKIIYSVIVPVVRAELAVERLNSVVDLNAVQQACANADPNYGTLWFGCRRLSTETPRKVIVDAANDVAILVKKYAHIYLAAMLRRTAIFSAAGISAASTVLMSEDDDSLKKAALQEEDMDEVLTKASPLSDILNPVDPTTGLGMLGTVVSGLDFSTALSGLRDLPPLASLSLYDRHKVLYGTDALFP